MFIGLLVLATGAEVGCAANTRTLPPRWPLATDGLTEAFKAFEDTFRLADEARTGALQRVRWAEKLEVAMVQGWQAENFVTYA
jgi:hypothetical protein